MALATTGLNEWATRVRRAASHSNARCHERIGEAAEWLRMVQYVPALSALRRTHPLRPCYASTTILVGSRESSTRTAVSSFVENRRERALRSTSTFDLLGRKFDAPAAGATTLMSAHPTRSVVKRDLELAGRRRELGSRRGKKGVGPLFALLPLITLVALLTLSSFSGPPSSTATVSQAALTSWSRLGSASLLYRRVFTCWGAGRPRNRRSRSRLGWQNSTVIHHRSRSASNLECAADSRARARRSRNSYAPQPLLPVPPDEHRPPDHELSVCMTASKGCSSASAPERFVPRWTSRSGHILLYLFVIFGCA